jgi:hypothetical protein
LALWLMMQLLAAMVMLKATHRRTSLTKTGAACGL